MDKNGSIWINMDKINRIVSKEIYMQKLTKELKRGQNGRTMSQNGPKKFNRCPKRQRLKTLADFGEWSGANESLT